MSQITFSDYEYSMRKRKTKREEFLDIMNEIIPWDELVDFVHPYCSCGKRGRPTKGIEKMLRMYLLQVSRAALVNGLSTTNYAYNSRSLIMNRTPDCHL